MDSNTPQQLDQWIRERLEDEEPPQGGDSSHSDWLRELAREVNQVLSPNALDWARYLSTVIPIHLEQQSLIGLYGLGRSSAELDDLFGERVGGLARELTDISITDELASVVGWWVLEDMSRVGYLEAWAVRGENPYKKRLGVIATIRLNKEGHNQPAETFRVVRHLMTSDDQQLRDAAAKAIRHVQDEEQVERFLAWWAPRVDQALLEQASQALQTERRERLLSLV